jgi:hypothetical protein
MYLMPDMDKWKDYKIKWQDPWLARGRRLTNLRELCEAALALNMPEPAAAPMLNGWMPQCRFGRGVVTSFSRQSSTPPVSNKGPYSLTVELEPPGIYVKANVYVLGRTRKDRCRRNLPTSIDSGKPIRLHWVYTNGTVLKCCEEDMFGRLLRARTLSLWIRSRSGPVRIDFDLTGLADAIASVEAQTTMRRQLRSDFEKQAASNIKIPS